MSFSTLIVANTWLVFFGAFMLLAWTNESGLVKFIDLGISALYRALNAASDLMKDDSLSRLEDESVRKLVFMLTDGKQYCSGMKNSWSKK